MTTFPFSSTPARSARLIVVALALMLAVALVVALPGLIWADTFITTVDTGTNALGDAGAASAVALKSNGLAVISYWDKTAGNVGDLKIGFCNDPACSNPTIQTVDPQMFDARGNVDRGDQRRCAGDQLSWRQWVEAGHLQQCDRLQQPHAQNPGSRRCANGHV